MTLPDISLDDRDFQSLVTEARTRIARTSPEWNEHNVSDPGITLIELFAWMTEMTIYRLNRVPEKIHVQLLDMLGIKLRPPAPAETGIRMILSAAPAQPLRIGPGELEVANMPTAAAPEIIFENKDERTIEPLLPMRYLLKRSGTFTSITPDRADGAASPSGDECAAFSSPPRPGDAIMIGFEQPIGGLIVDIDVSAAAAHGAGVDPDRPPLVWEVCDRPVAGADDHWVPCDVIFDETKGFNAGDGTIRLALPPVSAEVSYGTKAGYWLRCRVLGLGETKGGTYTKPPQLVRVSVRIVGATLPALHGTRVVHEVIGESDGTMGQRFILRESPVIAPDADRGEVLEVREPGSQVWTAWEPVESFAYTTEQQQVYVVDAASGAVELGPALRDQYGKWAYHGAFPKKGAQLRMAAYRHGGGRGGNVAAGALRILKSGPAGIASVSNPHPARGGVDGETLQEIRTRGPLSLRARHRAVTVEDFEYLAGEDPRVARVVCLPPATWKGAVADGADSSGNANRDAPAAESAALASIGVRILPSVHEPVRQLTFDELQASPEVLARVKATLDERRLLGARIDVTPVRFRGVRVEVEVITPPLGDPVRIREDVEDALYRYLNPLVGGVVDREGTGWPFGRHLNVGEVFGVVNLVQGVERVSALEVFHYDLQTGKKLGKAQPESIQVGPDELIASGRHSVTTKVREVGA